MNPFGCDGYEQMLPRSTWPRAGFWGILAVGKNGKTEEQIQTRTAGRLAEADTGRGLRVSGERDRAGVNSETREG